MSEKFLGFLEKNASEKTYFKGLSLEWTNYIIDKDKLVSVVSVADHNKEVGALRKHMDAIISFRDKKFVSVEWLESLIKKNTFDEDFSIKPADLLCAVRKQAKVEK